MAKILVIDDQSSIRNTLKDILQCEGYEIDIAEDGEQGLEVFNAGKYDMVLCDIKMPKLDGMDVFVITSYSIHYTKLYE